MSLLAGQCLQDVHLIKKKINLIITKELCKKLKESATEIINHEKKMAPLTHKENNFYNEQEICYICKEKFCVNKDDKDYIDRKKG